MLICSRGTALPSIKPSIVGIAPFADVNSSSDIAIVPDSNTRTDALSPVVSPISALLWLIFNNGRLAHGKFG